MGKHTPRAAAMRRHPAGKRLISHTDATVYAFPLLDSLATATADTANQEGNDND